MKILKAVLALLLVPSTMWGQMPMLPGVLNPNVAAAASQSIVQYINASYAANPGSTSHTFSITTTTGSGTHAFLVWFVVSSAGSNPPAFAEAGGPSDTFNYITQSLTGCPSNQYGANVSCSIAYVCSGSSGVTGITVSNLVNGFQYDGFAFIEIKETGTYSGTGCLDSNTPAGGASSAGWTRSGSSPMNSANLNATGNDILVGLAINASAAVVAASPWTNASAAPGGASNNFSANSPSALLVEYQLGVSAGNHYASVTSATPNGGTFPIGFLQ